MSWSALNAAELVKEHSSRIYFLYIGLAGDPFYGCTGTRSYTFASGLVSPEPSWLGLGDIAGLGDVTLASDIAARPLVLTLSGVDAYITEPLLSRPNYKNKTVIVYRGFLDENEDLVDAPDVIWKGRADVGTVSLEQGSAVATLSCEPDTARLLRPNVSRYANEDHQQRHAGDTFYEYLAQMETKTVLWGGVRVLPGQRGATIGDGNGYDNGGTPWSRDKF